MNYYASLEVLPLTVWEKCLQGHLITLRINPDVGTEQEDFETWEELNFEHMELFGVERSQQKHAQLQKELISKEMEYLETGNRMLLNAIRRIKGEIQQLFVKDKQSEGMTIDDSLVHLSKFMGFFLQKSQLMTKQYFDLVKQYGKANTKK